MNKTIPRLHVITDETIQDRFSHAELAEFACLGGADCVQYREKRPLTTRAMMSTVSVIAGKCTPPTVLVVDDRVDVAKSTGVMAVHLGAADLDVATARAILGRGAMIGGTANSYVEAQQVWQSEVDYLGVGPVYGTTSKADPAPEMGLATLGQICADSPKPIIAIGSITAERIAEVMATGAHGVAVLSAVVAAPDPAAAAAECVAEIQQAIQPSR